MNYYFKKILIYKRTHKGDPSIHGIFGCHDCMGSVRNYEFDAVIGIGGVGKELYEEGISEKITWVGINPYEVGRTARGRKLSFERFILLDEIGPRLENFGESLKNHLFERNTRIISKSLNTDELCEANSIINTVLNYMPGQYKSIISNTKGIIEFDTISGLCCSQEKCRHKAINKHIGKCSRN